MRIVVLGVFAESLLSFRGDLLRSMADDGHDVIAMAPEDDEIVGATLADMGVRYVPVALRRAGTSPLEDIASFMRLVRMFRDFRPDTVLAYAAKPVIYGTVAARLARVPMRAALITGVGSALGGGAGIRRRALSALLRRLYAFALHEAHVIFFQNPDDERLFRSLGLFGRNTRVVRVNGSGVDLERFPQQPLAPGPTTFLMIARLLRDKGVIEYIEAARVVHRAHPDVRIQLLGALDPNPSAISEPELERLRTEGIVDYLGTTPDVRPFLARAHVCVLPSYGEGMPRAILEAMATGRAIVTTDVPGCRETVVEQRNGLLVPARDARALADAMLQLVPDPSRLERMGVESRAIAEERFDVHEVNRAILEALGVD